MDEDGTGAVRQDDDGAWSVTATAATALALYRPRTLKNGSSFLVLDHFGDAQAIGSTAEGLFHDDTRFLSRLSLRLAGLRPLLLSSAVSADNTVLSVNMTNPDIPVAPDRKLMRDSVHVERQMVLGSGVVRERITLRNFAETHLSTEMSLTFAADFADIFEVRGQKRARRGERRAPEIRPDGSLVFAYRGLDDLERRTRLRFDPAPDGAPGRDNRWPLELPPGGRQVIEVTITCESGPEAEEAEAPGFDGLLAGIRAWCGERDAARAQVVSSNQAFNDWFARSESDLTMLTTQTPSGPFPYAGIPWFSCPFGRDSIITALQCLWADPELARGVLRYHAKLQATAMDPARDAEPGKILHESRKGEMAALREVPFGRYYGSVDSTPLFVVLATQYAERTGDWALIREIWPNIVAALGWIERHGDIDGDLLLEYDRQSLNGLINQGWKDSWDSVFHEDGRLADAPIALIEVQAYAEAAWRGAGRMAKALGHEDEAAVWTDRADAVRARVEEAFWCEELSTYALALDGEKRPCRVRSSNAGHALLTGLPSPDRARRIAQTLMAPESFCGWGIRTIAEGESRYNPMSYHNGSVWPHDNGLIALGMKRYGLNVQLERLLTGLYDSALSVDMHRLPELFCGFPRRHGEGPTAYPVACLPQAWAAASAYAALGAMLGVSFRPEEGVIRFQRPFLPAWLEELRIENLRLGTAAVDVRLRRHEADGSVSLNLLRRRGQVEVAVIT
ncbi:Glycogen debranching enzyme (alpha-1,6-glucosidase) [Roseomonas rosea]|uniref:Glycogen debranching enzyme (Alpha-1,6-glucosidase) n=1 Tax=Muricoccus roseus TaxID=198092 RepID=A0A1M6QHI5_9PROT|nr:amylo-alpha-1,6-glucosidase [Roseomonas rosea]SHK19702.1 Glycogen debranching enzyme (alpha-1,6-glucosidase) [Roseomonas rosea]